MNRLALCVVLASAAAAAAQEPGAANKAAMKKLDFLAGKWKGDATVVLGPQGKRAVKQTEDVQSRLGGQVLIIEGVGRGKLPNRDEEGIVFNALAVISYDAQARQYRMKAFRAEGLSVEPDITVSDRGFVWSFKEPQRGTHIKYTMTLTDKGEWHEVGAYSPDGTAWTQFFEMTLTRVKE